MKNVELNNGSVIIHVESNYDFAICPKCNKVTQDIYDCRFQAIRHLPLCDKETIINLTFKRYSCNCDKEHSFTGKFKSIRMYQRQTIVVEELKSFSNTLTKWRMEILNYYDHYISNGFVEGMNYKVKKIKHRAYNYRNIDNFKTLQSKSALKFFRLKNS